MVSILQKTTCGLILIALLLVSPIANAQQTIASTQQRIAITQQTSTNAQQAIAPEGFEVLFNGQDLSNWHAVKTYNPREFAKLPTAQKMEIIAKAKSTTGKHWSVENGEIVNDGQGPFLTTDRSFRDFELLIEYKTVAKADSGVYLKATPQVQIWDTTEAGGKWNIGGKKGSGGLWNNSPGAAGKDPLVKADKPFGQWNKLRILQVGSRTSVWLNDQHVVQHAIMENYWNRKLPLVADGPIQLQTHGGEIRWRNVFVRELSPQEANEYLSQQTAGGYKEIFNGKDFAGWKGPIDGYEVVDGSLKCKKGTGGTIYTADVYSDFAVRFEFKLPPGGNNGLAIRYPGAGDTAYVGMTELQVLDNESKKFKGKLDARQYHGSAYGKAAAHRGYLRPAGQWNFQEVTVVGSTIQVELNGTVILDADISKATDLMYGEKKHSGKNRVEGHFGFAGHNDPVEFRNVFLRDLSGQ